MEIKEIFDIKKKDSLLFYRNEYSGAAVFVYGNDNSEETIPISFSVEKTALGIPKIKIRILKHINYPMLGASAKLKQYIENIEIQRKLP